MSRKLCLFVIIKLIRTHRFRACRGLQGIHRCPPAGDEDKDDIERLRRDNQHKPVAASTHKLYAQDENNCL